MLTRRARRIGSVSILACILAVPAGASGWRTVVQDHAAGVRVAGMMGTAEDGEVPGIVVSCAADSDLPAQILVAISRPLPFDLAPGSPADISIAGLELDAVVHQNDSAGTSVGAETDSLLEIIERMESTSNELMVAVLAGGIDERFTVPADGLKLSIDQLRLVCGL